MIDYQSISVEVFQVAPNAVEASCPGDASWTAMFKAYDVDLTNKSGTVTFPFWYKQPIVAKVAGQPEQCIFWGKITMTTDTAVAFVQQALWALMSETIPAEYWNPPTIEDLSTYVCDSAKYMILIAQMLYGLKDTSSLAGWPIDGAVFAYLMTYNPNVQALAKAAAADYPALRLGEPWPEGNALLGTGGAVVPPPQPELGARFVPLGVPQTCAPATVPPGTVPGAPPGLPGETVGAKEGYFANLPGWVLPVSLFAGAAVLVGGVGYAMYHKRQPEMGY